MQINQICCFKILLLFFTFISFIRQCYQLEIGYRMKNSVFAIFQHADRNYCKQQCAYRTDCLSFNINRKYVHCELNSEDKSTIQNFVADPDYEYEEKSNFLEYIDNKCASKICPTNFMCVEVNSGVAKCVRTECEEPPSITNAVVDTIRSVTKSISYTCVDGYAAIGSTSITCKANGDWTSTQLECRKCPSPPSLSRATVYAPSTLVGKTAKYTCQTGYYVTGTGVITCQSNAEWSAITFQCNIRDCSTPPSVVANSITSYSTTTYQSTVNYGCQAGYDITGSSNISSCQANSVWSAVNFTCNPKDCGAPPSVSNAYVSGSGTTYLSTMTYNCNPGDYTLRGNQNSITCQASGSWSDSSFYCGCGSVPSAANANVQSGGYKIGDRRSYTCSKSFHTCWGDGTIVCQSSGRWTNPSCTCCGALPSSVLGAQIAASGGFQLGTSRSYYCYSNEYTCTGAGNIYCQSSGRWTNPSCSCSSNGPGPGGR